MTHENQDVFGTITTHSFREQMEKGLETPLNLTHEFNQIVVEQLKIIESIKPTIHASILEREELEERIQSIVEGYQAAGIPLPQMPVPEGVFVNEHDRALIEISKRSAEKATEIASLQAMIDQEEIFKAMKILLDYQDITLGTLMEMWTQDPERLIVKARSLRKEIVIKTDDEFGDVISDIVDLLSNGGLIVKVHLIKALTKRGHKTEIISAVINQILQEGSVIEAGWCNDVGRATFQNHHAGGMLFKLPDQELPEGIRFYKGYRKDEITELIRTKVHEFVLGLTQPMTVKQIMESYNQNTQYPISNQRLGEILWELYSNRLIRGENLGRTALYGPVSEEDESKPQETTNFEDLSSPFGSID